MKTSFILISIVIIAALVLTFVFRERVMDSIFGNPDMGSIDFSEIRKSKKPNQALACPPELCPNSQPDIASPTYRLPAKALREKLREALANEQLLVLVETDPELEDRYVQRSPFWRFPDTIQVKFIPLSEETSTIAIFARAKIGETDFQANRKRIERWLSYLMQYEIK